MHSLIEWNIAHIIVHTCTRKHSNENVMLLPRQSYRREWLDFRTHNRNGLPPLKHFASVDRKAETAAPSITMDTDCDESTCWYSQLCRLSDEQGPINFNITYMRRVRVRVRACVCSYDCDGICDDQMSRNRASVASNGSSRTLQIMYIDRQLDIALRPTPDLRPFAFGRSDVGVMAVVGVKCEDIRRTSQTATEGTTLDDVRCVCVRNRTTGAAQESDALALFGAGGWHARNAHINAYGHTTTATT